MKRKYSQKLSSERRYRTNGGEIKKGIPPVIIVVGIVLVVAAITGLIFFLTSKKKKTSPSPSVTPSPVNPSPVNPSPITPSPVTPRTPAPIPTTLYKCHNYTLEEIQKEPIDEKRRCQRFGNIWTGGNNTTNSGCGTCYCCEYTRPPWKCHLFAPNEVATMKLGYSAEDVCKAASNVWTAGNNTNFQGCGTCGCCEKVK